MTKGAENPESKSSDQRNDLELSHAETKELLELKILNKLETEFLECLKAKWKPWFYLLGVAVLIGGAFGYFNITAYIESKVQESVNSTVDRIAAERFKSIDSRVIGLEQRIDRT